jgi:hypothetical protein
LLTPTQINVEDAYNETKLKCGIVFSMHSCHLDVR